MSKTILLLGATSDVAIAMAKDYAKAGNQLILAGRDITRTSTIQKDIEVRFGAAVHAVVFDAEDLDSHRAFFSQLPAFPDTVVAAFGYLSPASSGTTDVSEIKRSLLANYVGAATILEQYAALAEEKGIQSEIIGISSVAGERGRGSNYLYGSAKAGFTAYLSGLRSRLSKKGHHVLTVIPGFMATKMTKGVPLPKPLTVTPEEASKQIIKAARKKKDVCYVSPKWRLVMAIIKAIPEPIFKRLSL